MTKYIIDYLKLASQKTPSNTALLWCEESINYKALDTLSEKIALGLKSKGIKSGENIGLYLNKSIQSIASIYAILKLGCCYVPISLDCPEKRLFSIVEKCAIQHLLIEEPPKELIQSYLQKNDVYSFTVAQLLAADIKGKVMRPVITGEEPAAILHTSGSTGAPKGAVITQKNLAVFVLWAKSAFKLSAEDRLLSHAPLQFDLSFFDFFATVCASASVVLATYADTVNSVRMEKLVNDSGVTVWQSVPSALTLQVISNTSQQAALHMPMVRCVIFAGERMPRTTLMGISKLFANARFYNIYGCTETNNTFMYSLPDDLCKAPDPLPIGKVLPHILHKIINKKGVPVAPGEKGHLLVSGETIMAGYIAMDSHGKPIYKKHNDADGFYPTQDIVSVSESGDLSFHGRLDNIIKSNGYRINLLEIEDYLNRSQKIAEVAVLSEPDELIGNRIIAIYKLKKDQAYSTLDLKIFCAKTLPKYAIPHRFFLSDKALPKGSTGKIDKQQLAKKWQLAIC